MKLIGQVIVIVSFLGTSISAFAADSKPAKPAPELPPIIEPGPTHFEPQLLKMAELMGSLAFLADICPDGDGKTQSGQIWRDKTALLMEAETSGLRLKGLMAGAYNRGYSELEVNYKGCAEPALALYEHDLEVVHKLSQDLTRRYSGN